MKKDEWKNLPELEEFASQVGSFMEYWGFKKVHGQIWCHIYLSSQPLDASELMKRLEISKALVSISLKELLDFEVIEEVGKSARGTRLYKAREDLRATILDTLRRRERKMMARIMGAFSLLEKLDDAELQSHKIEQQRLAFLGLMIRMVDMSLDQMIKKPSGTLFDVFSMLKLPEIPKGPSLPQ
ncbi:MAG: ArsR family transcriptional regulator [Proteobacteria bacterium]|nr:MAG: ArsR family transcriptional regulator [Pseudomonadota bacterium]